MLNQARAWIDKGLLSLTHKCRLCMHMIKVCTPLFKGFNWKIFLDSSYDGLHTKNIYNSTHILLRIYDNYCHHQIDFINQILFRKRVHGVLLFFVHLSTYKLSRWTLCTCGSQKKKLLKIYALCVRSTCNIPPSDNICLWFPGTWCL